MTCHFSGHVQGVGFRFTCREIASRYDARGFVRNLADGRVELVIEGVDSELNRVLDDVKHKMRGYIENVAISYSAASNEFDDFRIAH